MKHLKELNITYWNHFKIGLINVFKLLTAFCTLIIHILIPCLLTHTTSSIIKNIQKSFPKCKQDRILVRFNTKWETDPQFRQWRVLVNGVETLSHKVLIEVPVETIQELVGSELKFHFLCFGHVIEEKDVISIIKIGN